MKFYHKIFAVIFIVALLGFAIINFSMKFHSMKMDFSEVEISSENVDVKLYTSEIDRVVSDNLLFEREWNEVYAMVYNALGKNEENCFKYVRDKNGILYESSVSNESSVPIREFVKRINVIRKKVKNTDTKVVVLLYPCRYNDEWTNGYKGIPYKKYNALVDDMTAYFRYYSVDYIDYREYFIKNEWKATDIFYKTDQHWTTLAAFAGYGQLVQHLNENYDANLNTYYTNIDNYNLETYEKYFIGDYGRDAGVAYVGLDDFTLVSPKYETNYTIKFTDDEGVWEEQSGDVYKTLIDLSYFEEEDYYNKDMYSTYLNAINEQATVINNGNNDGLKVLFISDSYTSPLGVFFAPHCSQMDFMWSENNSAETMEAAIESEKYDYIFIGLTIDSYVNGGFEIYVDEVLTNE